MSHERMSWEHIQSGSELTDFLLSLKLSVSKTIRAELFFKGSFGETPESERQAGMRTISTLMAFPGLPPKALAVTP